MSRIDRNHHTTPFLGLILDFCLEARKRPRVHPAFGLASPLCLHPFTNVFEVFQNNRRTWLGGLDDLLTQHMISIRAETRTTAFQLPQMPFGAFRAFLLQGAHVLEVATFDRLPAPPSQETVVRRDRRAVDAQVHADTLAGFRFIRCRRSAV
jgi:hypothetical protein